MTSRESPEDQDPEASENDQLKDTPPEDRPAAARKVVEELESELEESQERTDEESK